MAQYEFGRMRYIVRKLFDLELHIHAIEAEPSLPLPADIIGHTVALMLDLNSSGILIRSLLVYVYSFVVSCTKDPRICKWF